MSHFFTRLYEIVVNRIVRITLSVVLGLLVYFLIPRSVLHDVRILLAWDLGLGFLLGIVLLMMFKSDARQTWHRAQGLEPSTLGTLLVTVVTCGGSLVAVGFMINNGQNWKMVPANVHLALCTIAIFAAWFLLHTVFAIHYACMYYDEIEGKADECYKRGLEFPGGKLVDYWDFMYYSITIAMCYQTSDVSVTSREMRRVTLIHAIVSFVFVATIIGLVVNVVSNLT